MKTAEELKEPDFSGLQTTDNTPPVEEKPKKGRKKADKVIDSASGEVLTEEKTEKVSKYKAKQQSIEFEADLILTTLNTTKGALKEGATLNPLISQIWRESYIETCKKHNIGLMAKPEYVLAFSSVILVLDVIPQDKTGDIMAVAKSRFSSFIGMFKREK